MERYLPRGCMPDPMSKQQHTVMKAIIREKSMQTTTQPFNGLFSRTTCVSRYQKGKTNLDFTRARDSEWQWHQLGHMQVCTSLQTDNHTNTPPLVFYRQDALPAAQPTASIRLMKLMQKREIIYRDYKQIQEKKFSIKIKAALDQVECSWRR